jgi:FkbM family methyltransferase
MRSATLASLRAVDEVLESVVAENRQLQKDVKTLRARVTALESSRWWRMNPREVIRRLGSGSTRTNGAATTDDAEKVKRATESWRLKVAYRRRASDGAPDEIVVREGIPLKVHPKSRGPFEEFCYGSPDVVHELDSFIAATADRRRLLDIGAYHGLFSLVFAARHPARRALAVDASPIAFAPLLYNIHRNGADNITAIETALSSQPGILEMHYQWEHAVAGQGNDGTPLRIEATTGDELCERQGFEPDVVKIDVEGHELRVLQGLQVAIERNRPLVFLEIHPWHMSQDARNGTLGELVDELLRLGYPNATLRGSAVSTEALADVIEIERVLLRPV